MTHAVTRRVAPLAASFAGPLVVAACAHPAPLRSAPPPSVAASAQATAQPAAGASAVPFVRMVWNGAEVRVDYQGRSLRYRFDGPTNIDDGRKCRQRPYLYAVDRARRSSC